MVYSSTLEALSPSGLLPLQALDEAVGVHDLPHGFRARPQVHTDPRRLLHVLSWPL